MLKNDLDNVEQAIIVELDQRLGDPLHVVGLLLPGIGLLSVAAIVVVPVLVVRLAWDS
jgi:hypothetical protein